MSEFSLRDLCCLICCPPFPAAIAAKVAFLPPPKTYSVIQDPISQHHTLHLSDRAEWQYDEREKDLIDVFFTRTSRGNQIACFYVKASINPKFTILFSHGNAVDIGQMSSFFLGLGSRLDCNILGYDYSGYGCSTGSPSEKNLYADINAAWNTLRSKYSLLPEKVILYGQSIGTVPTVDLASRVQCAGVVLHSPLMSGIRVACPNSSRTWCFDPFPSIEKVNRISSKLLVIHGTEDEVIDFSHGLAIHAKSKTAVEPLWVEGAGHNDIELYSAYLERLKKFVGDDMKNGVTLNGTGSLGSTTTSETGNSGDTGPAKVRGNVAPYLDKIRNPNAISSSLISNNTNAATAPSNTNNTTVHIIGASGAANVDTMQTSKSSSSQSPQQPSKNSQQQQQNGVIAPPPSAGHPPANPASNSPIVTVKSS